MLIVMMFFTVLAACLLQGALSTDTRTCNCEEIGKMVDMLVQGAKADLDSSLQTAFDSMKGRLESTIVQINIDYHRLIGNSKQYPA